MNIFKIISKRFKNWRAKKLDERTVTCPAKMLFEIIEKQEKEYGLTSDILFGYKDKTYFIGVYADFADIKRNLRWYTNTNGNKVFDTFEGLKENARLDGKLIRDMDDEITILEINGCYPDSDIKALAAHKTES